MALTRRLVLWMALVLVPALALAWLAQTLAARDALQAQIGEHNRHAAATIAVALERLQGDTAQWRSLVDAWIERGRYRRIVLASGERGPIVERVQAERSAAVPAWFGSMFSFDVEVGQAEVRREGQPIGVLSVASQDDWARLALWDSARRGAIWMLLGAVLAVVAAAWALRGLRRALAETVQQAQAIAQARFVTADEPEQPELREVTRAMNSMVQRLRELFDAQAEQVAQLQHQVQTDAVSGLPVRSQFMLRLHDMLAESAGPATTLLLVRVPELERLNERHGREATDRLLLALADVLLTYVDRVPGSAAARLNGTDFALCLPAAGIARETAESLRGTLETSPPARLAGARFLFGGCDGLLGIGAGEALAAADAALARAEQEDGIAVVDLPDAAHGGARAWRGRIADALAEGRIQLGAYPVVDAQGMLIHLECPLRVQMEPGGDYQVARRWLALAARSRLLPEVDLAAVGLALAAIEADGRPRCVHVAPRSFAEPAFAPALRARLEAHAAAARRLAIEWTESAPGVEAAPPAETLAQWRRLGVSVGVEHAGASPKGLLALKEIGVDYVKVDARHLRGLAQDTSVQGYAQSLVSLIHGLGLQAIAEGIDEPRDLNAVWALGFDGATGSALPPTVP